MTLKMTSFDRINSYLIFVKVAHEQSFSRSAQRLHLSASAVTKEIKKLEEHLGVSLFHRTTRSVSLTDEGVLLLNRIRPILDGIEEAELELSSQVKTVKGSLRITAPAILGQEVLSPLVNKFIKKNPYIDIELVLTDRVIDLVDDGFDLALRTSYQLKDTSQYFIDLGEIKRVVCASEDYLHKLGRPKKLEDLGKHNCLLFIRGQVVKQWIFEKNRQKQIINVDGNYQTNNLRSLVSALKDGLGVANIPSYLVCDEIKEKSIIPLLKGFHLPTYKLFAMYSKKRSSSRKLDTFLSFLQDNI
jgi:DNA-binding transcriptional LysR family regulator